MIKIYCKSTEKVRNDFLYTFRYNLKENNVILADVSHAQLIEDMISLGPVEYCAGGAGLNSLRAAQVIIFIKYFIYCL